MHTSPRTRLAALWLLVFLVPAGCSVPQDDNQPGKSYTAYVDAVTSALLKYEQRCGLLDQSRTDQRKALLSIKTFPAYLTQARDQAAKDARVSYDPTCIVNGLSESAPCSAARFDVLRTTCAATEATGTVTQGRSCRLPEECKAGLFCKGVAQDSPCGSGTCSAQGRVGDQCSEGARACDPAIAYCSGGSCLPRVGEGQSCQENAGCPDGLRCIKAMVGDAQGKCAKAMVGKMGEACDPLDQAGKLCDTGLACYKDMGGAYLCQGTVALGMPCRSTEACQGTATCVRAMAMDPTGTCKPLGKPTEACSKDSSVGSGCQITLTCFAFDSMSQAICSPQPDNGQRCQDALPCLVGTCDKNQAQPSCRARAGAGLACTNNDDCASGQCDAKARTCKAAVCA